MLRIDQDKILLLKGQIRNDIRSIRYSDQTSRYQVMFDNGKMFQYNPENVVYLRRKEDLQMPIRVTRLSDGMVFQNILGVSTFVNPLGVLKAYRVVFDNGAHRDYLADNLLVEKHLKGEKARSVSLI